MMHFLLALEQAAADKLAQATWEKLATYGALGLICAWLFIERWLVGGKERAARHGLAKSLDENTKATIAFTSKIEDLSRAIWQFILTKGGQTGPGSPRKEDTSSAHHPKVREADSK